MVPERHAKQVLVEKLLDFGMVMVILDARQDGVDVPQHLRNESQLRLNLSYRFGKPLEIDHAGVRAMLTYGGVPYETVLPWSSIYAVLSQVSGHPYVFPDDIPRDVAAEIVEAQRQAVPQSAVTEPASLTAVESPSRPSAETTPRTAPGTPREPEATQQPGVALRVIEGTGPDDSGGTAEGGEPPPDDRPPRRKPRLRLVK